MTTFRLFIHRRDSVRWLVLAMALGSIALAMAALACGPAAPTSPGAGETAANTAASDQPPSDGAEPITIPQQASGTDETPTPRPTICSNTRDSQGNPITDCGPPPPMVEDDGSNVDPVLMSLVEKAQQEQAERQGAGDQAESVPQKRQRVWIWLTADTDGNAIVAWLEQRGFTYEDHRDAGTIYASVDLVAIPALSEVEGVFRLMEPIKNDPA